MATFLESLQVRVDAVAAGTEIWPDEFNDRCVTLVKRGLTRSLVLDLRATGDLRLLRQVEALSAADMARLNAAATA